MKFTSAFANVLSQNMTLRAAVALLSLCSLFFCISTIRLAVRDPIVIERTCYSKALEPVDPKHTSTEIEAFIRGSVPSRFDSNSNAAQFLSTDELMFRNKEQDELLKKEMTQKVVVNSIKLDGARFIVDTDRIISIGKVRTALAFPLIVELSSTTRSEINPYGLVLKRVSQFSEEGNKNEKK
ncbi:MAG: hypothetical protein HY537_05665 [Deltaproteobacteria bacterium]|nr:hypothetical protein [Deltaproteobacteria bacterium]